MRLNYANIQNFRSIKEITIKFEPQCRVLVGINESGKSNILKALALLDSDRQVLSGDLRDFLPHEDPSQPAFVRFIFTLEKHERISNFEYVQSKILTPDFAKPILSSQGKELSLAQFFESRTEGLYTIDLRTGARTYNYWSLPDGFKMFEIWKKPSPQCPRDLQIITTNGIETPLIQFSLIHESLVRDIPSDYLIDVNPNDINTLAGSQIIEVLKKTLPKCLYWSYSDSHLLPAQIPLDSFAANPGICEPLRHMFELADISDIGLAVTEAKTRNHGVRNLLNRVANRATKHMKSVWREYRGITIELAPNGPNIDASIKDEYNLYDFSRRSDGFKRFVTFLMMVSVKVRTEDLINTLYLHDEPDISLHPSGARYLRDELIKMSVNNYVIYSTHSIFMIDRELIRRHLIVEKQKEITEISEVNDSNITEEEVVYNALGYSIFENLKKRNIIFEGWRDKRLCQVALRSVPLKHKILKTAFNDVGMCHARGVKDIGRITPMLELADRSWIVLSDGDPPAIEQQKQYDGDGPWYRYDQLLNNSIGLTGEDFIKPEVFRQHLENIRSNYPNLLELKPEALSLNEPKLTVIRKWLQQGGLSGQALKTVLEELKERLFKALRPGNIEDKYYDLLEVLAKKLQDCESSP